jgi:hypothetical protein
MIGKGRFSIHLAESEREREREKESNVNEKCKLIRERRNDVERQIVFSHISKENSLVIYCITEH